MRKTTEIICSVLVVVFFLVVIFGLGVRSVYENVTNYTDYSYYENRNLAAFPEKDKAAVLDGSFFSSVETWCRDHLAERDAILTEHTLLNMNVLDRPVVNEVVITDGVLLPYNKPEVLNQKDINVRSDMMASRLRSHADVTEANGGQFIYVAVPCQYVYYEDSYPWYLNSRAEFTEASSTALFKALDQKSVPYIDMRERFDDLGHLPEYSSTVDNHYSIFGAYETYRAIMEKYNAASGAALPILTDKDYTVTTLPNPYIGSRTRKLLGLWKSDEHLSIITPNTDVPFTRWNYGNEKPGSSKVYSLPATDTEDTLYRLYMGDDCSETKIATDRPDLPTVLIYGDSFTNAVESIIWYNFDTMYSFDLRYYKEKPLEELIAAIKPDLVVCIRDYEALLTLEANGQ